jgi:hypothetical protein
MPKKEEESTGLRPSGAKKSESLKRTWKGESKQYANPGKASQG